MNLRRKRPNMVHRGWVCSRVSTSFSLMKAKYIGRSKEQVVFLGKIPVVEMMDHMLIKFDTGIDHRTIGNISIACHMI